MYKNVYRLRPPTTQKHHVNAGSKNSKLATKVIEIGRTHKKNMKKHAKQRL